MKIFKIDALYDECLNRFIEFSNTYWEDEWCIYLESTGGSTWIEGQISEILSRKLLEPQSCYLNVAQAYSAAFILIMKFKGKINVLEDAKGMHHIAVDTVFVNTMGKEKTHAYTNYESIMKDHNKMYNKREIEFCKTFMNDKELQDFKNGKDIYYNEKDLKRILKNKF